MERDCMIAHGASKFLKERMMDLSDLYEMYICNICGLFAQRMKPKVKESGDYRKIDDVYHCPACRNNTDVSKIRIPYAFKLLMQEMMSMNVAPRIRVKKSEYY